MKTREDFMSELNWIGPSRQSGNKSEADISITMCKKDGKSGVPFSFVFRNNCWKVFDTFEYKIAVAVYKNRLILESNATGYRLTGVKANRDPSTKYARIRIPEDQVDTFMKFIGDFGLQHEEFYDFWYVGEDSRL